jgi:hypothetical protein
MGTYSKIRNIHLIFESAFIPRSHSGMFFFPTSSEHGEVDLGNSKREKILAPSRDCAENRQCTNPRKQQHLREDRSKHHSPIFRGPQEQEEGLAILEVPDFKKKGHTKNDS